ncbi:MAG: Crp/Fnr family transcriptional regulator [Acidobacteriota bacterium]|nr:Crp/Fnr family transcriptional regulator [Acidobacteriota bacterium]MDQ5872307.1 Crp/Fnr family transcriptional regulator [Acidobacteriota bacterium]
MPLRPPIPFRAIPILSSLREEDRLALEPLCELRAYEKGATIFAEGDPAEDIHFLFLGRVKIVKSAGDRDLILEILGPGEPVGAVAVFERLPFPAAAVALEPSGVITIPGREFFSLIEKRPEITRRLLAGLTLRLMSLNRRLADMTGSVEHRIGRLLGTLAERLGQKGERGVFIPLALSRQDIADLVGTTVETAIRVMSRWQKEGLVETEKKGFRIPDPAALAALSPED